MSKVVFDICMSLGGFITAGNQSQEEPIGEGGQQLHVWMEDAGLLDIKEDGTSIAYGQSEEGPPVIL